MKKRSKQSRRPREFLETQAAQSGSESETHSDDSDSDKDISGLIDNNRHSPINTQDHAMYLRMQIDDRTPQYGLGKFKLNYKSKVPSSITPRVNNTDDEWYEEDSFCVNDDYIEYEDTFKESLDYISPSQPGPRTRRAQKRLKIKKEDVHKQSRRKVVILDDEDDDNQQDNKIDGNDQQRLQLGHLDYEKEIQTDMSKPCSLTTSLVTGSSSPEILSQTARRVSQSHIQKEETKIVIFISPRELQSAQSIVSELRATYSFIFPIIRSSSGTVVDGLDYVVSCRMVITRTKLSRLLPPTGNLVLRKKLLDELQNLTIVAERRVLIIETDIPDSTSGNQSR